ncbi:uncharacterized protein ACO6RY_16408 [Pungitius sinensis]
MNPWFISGAARGGASSILWQPPAARSPVRAARAEEVSAGRSSRMNTELPTGVWGGGHIVSDESRGGGDTADWKEEEGSCLTEVSARIHTVQRRATQPNTGSRWSPRVLEWSNS